MNHVAGLLSMLHEPAAVHSASRLFRAKPVLHWTLNRLTRAMELDTLHVACWADQADAVRAACGERDVETIVVGARVPRPQLQAMTAARRWADGWRGGLLGGCEFDRGFDAEVARELADRVDVDALLLIDPAAGLVDPLLIDAMVAHAELNPESELCFSQAAPGLGGVLVRRALVNRLAIAKLAPGRMLTYFPDHHGVDPIGKPGCVPIATPVARSTNRFTLDTHRQIERLTRAMQPLNGQLISTGCEELVRRLADDPQPDGLPRDVVLELNTDRHTKPIYRALGIAGIDRPPMSVELAKSIFDQLAVLDDVRITLAGVGDPLLSPNLFDILDAAALAGVHSIHVETDLVGIPVETVRRLARSNVDVVTVHVPAATPAVYRQVMGVDRWSEAMQNIAVLEATVAARGDGTPLIVPTFSKLAANLAEMESWYDYWLRRLGHAVIGGASDFAGQMVDPSLTDMSPPQRRPCHRIERRMTILSDGRVASCEQDVLGKQTIGTIGQTPISELWTAGFSPLRACHRSGEWASKPLCGKCREWHRP